MPQPETTMVGTDKLEKIRAEALRFGMAEDAVLATFATDTRNPGAIGTRVINALNMVNEVYPRAIGSLMSAGLIEVSLASRLFQVTDKGRVRLAEILETSPELIEMVDMTVQASIDLREHASIALGKVGLDQPPQVVMTTSSQQAE